jgi:ubiquinone biosynthesis protein Coq4
MLTLRQGLDRYYQANPGFNREQDLWVGWLRIPWCDLFRHDVMHVVTGYSTALDQELRLIGFLLTAITWRRPWYYYLQSCGVFLELLGRSLRGKAWGIYLTPYQVCHYYAQGVRQGWSIQPKIDAGMDPVSMLDRTLAELRSHYSIHNAGAWD